MTAFYFPQMLFTHFTNITCESCAKHCVNCRASKDKKTSSIFLQDGDRQCVESNVGASTEEADEQEGLERARLRN